jgi:hypothetical protein
LDHFTEAGLPFTPAAVFGLCGSNGPWRDFSQPTAKSFSVYLDVLFFRQNVGEERETSIRVFFGGQVDDVCLKVISVTTITFFTLGFVFKSFYSIFSYYGPPSLYGALANTSKRGGVGLCDAASFYIQDKLYALSYPL